MAEDKSLSQALERIFNNMARDDAKEKLARLEESRRRLGLLTATTTTTTTADDDDDAPLSGKRSSPPPSTKRSSSNSHRQQPAAPPSSSAGALGKALNTSTSANPMHSQAPPRSSTYSVGGSPPPKPRALPPLKSTVGGAHQRQNEDAAEEDDAEREEQQQQQRGPSLSSTAPSRRSTSNNNNNNTTRKSQPLHFWYEQLAEKFGKRRLKLQEREADTRHALQQAETDSYEHTLLAAWVDVRRRRSEELKQREDKAYAEAMVKNRENRLMHRLWSEEVRNVRNAIRAEYECEFDELVCYCRAVMSTAEQKALHAARIAEKREADEKARLAADASRDEARRTKQEERMRELVLAEERDGRSHVLRLEASTIAAMVDVFRTRRRALYESEGSIQAYWVRHHKRQMHLQHSMEWLIGDEVSKREGIAKAFRQRFDTFVSSYPDNYKLALQAQVVRQRGEARERAEVEELCSKARAVIEGEFTEALDAIKVVEEEERARTQAVIDRANRLASRRALADSYAAKERALMFEADNASWDLVRYNFEESLDFVAMREEAHARTLLAMAKAADKAYILALLRQRTNLVNASLRARAEIETECEEAFSAINEALQRSQDRFLLQWYETIRRRMVEDEYAEAGVVFHRHAKTLAASSQAFASAKKSAVDKPLTNSKSRFVVQLKKNVVPWFFHTEGVKFLQQATVRAAAAPVYPLAEVEEMDVTVEILNPHDGDTLDYTPAAPGRRNSYLPANYFHLLQLQQQQEKEQQLMQQQQLHQQQTMLQRNATRGGGAGATLHHAATVSSAMGALASGETMLLHSDTTMFAGNGGDGHHNGNSGGGGGALFGGMGELVEEEDTDAANPEINAKPPVETVQRRINIRKYTGDVKQLLEGISFRNIQPFNRLRIMQRIIRINMDTITCHVVVNVQPPIFSTPAVSVTTNVVTPLGSYTAPASREFKKIRCIVALDRETPDNTFNFKLPAAYFNHPKNGILMNGKYYMRIHTKTNALMDVEFDNTPTTDVRPLLNAIKVNRREGAHALKPMSLTLLITLKDDTTLQMHQFLDVDNSRLDAPKLRVHNLDLVCRVSAADGPVSKAHDELIDDLPFSLLSRASVRFPELQTQFCGGSLSLAVQGDPEANVNLSIRPIPSERYSFEVSEGVLWCTDNGAARRKVLMAAPITSSSRPIKAASNEQLLASSRKTATAAAAAGNLTARNPPVTARGGGDSSSAPSSMVDESTAATGGDGVATVDGHPLLTPQEAIAVAGNINTTRDRRFAVGYAFGALGNSGDLMIKFREDAFYDVALIDPLLRAVGYTYKRGAAPMPLSAKDKEKGYRLHLRLDVRTDQSVDPIDATFRVAVLPSVVDMKSDAFNYKERTGLKALPTMSVRPAGYVCSHEARILLEMVDGVDEDGSDEVTVMDCEADPRNPKQFLLFNAGAPIAAVIKHSKSKVEALLLPTDTPWRRTHMSQPYPTEAFHNGDVQPNAVNMVLRSLAFQSTSSDAQYLKKTLKLVVDDGLTGPTASLVQVTIESVDDPTDILLSTPEVSYRQLSRGLLTKGCPLMPGVRLEDVDSDNFHGGYISVEYTTGPSTEIWDDLVILTPDQQELTIHQPEDTSIYSSLYAILGSASQETIMEALDAAAQQQLSSSGAVGMPRYSMGGSRGGRRSSMMPPHSSIDSSGFGGGKSSPLGSNNASINENQQQQQSLPPPLGSNLGNRLTSNLSLVFGSGASAALRDGIGGGNSNSSNNAAAAAAAGLVPFPYLSLVAEMAPQKSLIVKDSRMFYAGANIGTITTRKAPANNNATTLTMLFRSDSKFVSFPAAEYAMRCIGYENHCPKIAAGQRIYTVRLNCTGLKSTAETVAKVGVNVSPAMLFLPSYASTIRYEGDKPKQLLKPAIVTMPEPLNVAALSSTSPAATTPAASLAAGGSPATTPSPPASTNANANTVLVNQGFLRLKITNTDDLSDELFLDESLGDVRLKEKSVIVGRDTVASIVPLVSPSVNNGAPKPNYLHLSFVKMSGESLEAVLRSLCFSYKNSNSKDAQNLRSRLIEVEFAPSNNDKEGVCFQQITVEMSRKDVPYAITANSSSSSKSNASSSKKLLSFLQGQGAPSSALLADYSVSDSKGKGFSSGWVIEASVAVPAKASGEYFVVYPFGGGASSATTSPSKGGGKADGSNGPSSLAVRAPTVLGPDNPSDALTIKSPRGDSQHHTSSSSPFRPLSPTTTTTPTKGGGGGNNSTTATTTPFYTIVDGTALASSCTANGSDVLPIASLVGSPIVMTTMAAEGRSAGSSAPCSPSKGGNSFASAAIGDDTASTASSATNLGPFGGGGGGGRSSNTLSSSPPLYFPANKSLFIVLEKTVSSSELREVLQCIGYCNNVRFDRDATKSINVTLHRPKGGTNSAASNSPMASSSSASAASALITSSSASSSSSHLADTAAAAIASSFIPLLRVELAVKIYRPMLDCSLCPLTLAFPWAGVAMGEAPPIVPIVANAKCDVPPEAHDVCITVFILTADTADLLGGGVGGGAASAANNPLNTSGGGFRGSTPQLAATAGAGAGRVGVAAARRASSLLVSQSFSGGGAAKGGAAAMRNSGATSATSRGVTWAIQGRRESDIGGGGAPRSAAVFNAFSSPANTNTNNAAALSPQGFAATAAAMAKYGLCLEWRLPAENPLGLMLDYSTNKIYSGVFGYAATAAALLGGGGGGSVVAGGGGLTPPNQRSSVLAGGSATPPAAYLKGASSTRALFGTLSVRGDVITVTYEPPHGSHSSGGQQQQPCDSLVAQAVLRCIHLVAKEDVMASSPSGDDGAASNNINSGGGDVPPPSSSAHERVGVPIVVAMSCSVGTNRSLVTVTV